MTRKWAVRAFNGQFLTQPKNEICKILAGHGTQPAHSETEFAKFLLYDKKKYACQFAKCWNKYVRDEQLPNDWLAEPVAVMSGFVLARTSTHDDEDVMDEMGVPDDLVWRRDVWHEINTLGGCDSEEGTWDAGWDDATQEALHMAEAVCGANIETDERKKM